MLNFFAILLISDTRTIYLFQLIADCLGPDVLGSRCIFIQYLYHELLYCGIFCEVIVFFIMFKFYEVTVETLQ